jgi:hypothetical protein
MKLSWRPFTRKATRTGISCRMNNKTRTNAQRFHSITPDRNKSMSPENSLQRKVETNLESWVYLASFVLTGTDIILSFLCFI